MEILITNGFVVDPKSGREGVYDILIKSGKVVKIDRKIPHSSARIVDASDKLVFPGLIDMHCHLREPGGEDSETIYSGSLSAVSGGFTTLCCMPNTTPSLDSKVAVSFVHERGKKALCEVLPVGAVTVDRQGRALPPYGEMVQEGAVAFSDDGSCVMDSLVMRRALEYTKLYKKPLISHAEDASLVGTGVMNEGVLSAKLGLAGIPRQAEEIIVARDLALADLTGGRLHLAHLSTAESVALLRQAKKRGIRATGEVTVHHLILTEDAVNGYNPNAKVAPSLKTAGDVKALIEGLKDDTIDCIVTDHAPHTDEEKESGFENAPFGVIGFETALSLALSLVSEDLPCSKIIKKFTAGPSGILDIDRGSIEEGKRADIAIYDPDISWIYKREDIVSMSKNSPFINRELKGRVCISISRGRIVYTLPAIKKESG